MQLTTLSNDEKTFLLQDARNNLLNGIGETLYPYQERFSNAVIASLVQRSGDDYYCEQPPQTGKSMGISRTVLPLAIYAPFVLGYPIKIGIYAPTYPQAGIIFRYIKELWMRLRACGFEIDLNENNRDIFQLANGSKIFTKSAEVNANLKGDPVNLAIIDEAAEIPEIQLKEGIQFRGGASNATYVYIGTPTMKMKNRYFFDAIHKAGPNTMIVHRAEAEAVNPSFAAFVAKRIAEDGSDSDFVKMQLDLQWVTQASSFVDWDGLIAMKQGQIVHDLANADIYVGIDWGKKNDSTVATVGALEGGKLVILKWLELKGDNYDQQLPIIAEFVGHYNRIRGIYCDSTATQDQIVDFARAAMPNWHVNGVVFTAQSKHDMFLLVQRVFNKRELSYPAEDCKERKRFEKQFLELVKEYKGNLMSPHAPEGTDYHDDYCFVAGTLVLTERGQVPIESIGVGDLVMTRQGFKPVRAIGSRFAPVIERLGLTGTPGHPVIVEVGLRKLKDVNEADVIYIWNEKQSSIEARIITDTLIRHGVNYANITGITASGRSPHKPYIGESTRITSVQSQKDTPSTTKMRIVNIIPLKTSKFYRGVCISQGIAARQNERNNPQKTSYDMPFQKQQSGLGSLQKQRKENPILKNMEKASSENPLNMPASNAISALHLVSSFPSVFVPSSVQDDIIDIRRVYNITVTDCEEYFANNILVHNCASLGLLVYGALRTPTPSYFMGGASGSLR